VLVSTARYRTITLDTTSPDASVTAALVEAQDMVEEEVRRPGALEYAANRTETLRLYRDGRVYPHAIPVWSVPATATYEVEDTSTLASVGPDGEPWVEWIKPPLYPVGTVIYTGGWKAADASGVTDAEKVPRKLERAIANLARAMVNGSTADVPDGATSVRLGDAAVTFAGATSGLDGIVPGTIQTLRGFRYTS
jgi:hypothetical protein